MSTCVRCHVVILPDDGRRECHFCRPHRRGRLLTPTRYDEELGTVRACRRCGEELPWTAEFFRERLPRRLRATCKCCEHERRRAA